MDQEERSLGYQGYKTGRKDVLVATDVASKGLDFPNIQHVINYDMPEDIENYVHRIGRTGRCGKTGIATTFINKGMVPRLYSSPKEDFRFYFTSVLLSRRRLRGVDIVGS